ncbi:MAG TPA: hypothetical protein PKM97_06230 [Bacteroidia bacterium]|nr:hypothetical protein [Bacteroidia bacterium]
MFTTTVSGRDLEYLREKCYIYNPENTPSKLNILNNISKRRLNSASMILRYQDIMLFLAAYPDTKNIYEHANNEIDRINRLSELRLYKAKQNKQVSFAGSGLASSYFIGSFSHAMCKWLLDNFPESISFHSFGDSCNSTQEILGMFLLPAETALQENYGLSVKRWLEQAGANKKDTDPLSWMLKTLGSQEIPGMLRDFIFDGLELYISFDIGKKNAQGLLRAPCGGTYYHRDGILKKIDLTTVINKNIGKPLTLSKNQKSEYLRVARFALLHLSRETDPVSYCEEDGIEVYDLDRGFSIALYYLPPERRNPVDAYVGYMIFKNRIPCGYGGAWLFGNKAKIGLNIFPAFRGGESAFLFSQILRTYKKRFNLRYFEAEPYQIGLENPEGIKSGAFWFYYKLGFRPLQTDLYELARQENDKLRLDPKHRTPYEKLKTLAHSMMFLDTLNPKQKTSQLIPDSINISKVITSLIHSNFEGDRMRALNYFKKELNRKCGISSSIFKKQNEKSIFNSLAPFLYVLIMESTINKKEKSALVRLIKSKAEKTEYNYLKNARTFQSRLQKAITKTK